LDNETNSGLSNSMNEKVGEHLPDVGAGREDVSILDLFLILAAKKKFIITLTILGGLFATLIAFLIPPTYTATAAILPPQQQSSITSSLIGQLGGMASLAGQSLGIKNPADIYIGILQSRTIADKLIEQFGLQKIYKKKTLVDVRKKLASRTGIDSPKSSLILVSVEDRDPKRAADLANAYIEQLQIQNSRLAVTESSQRRLFFERQMEEEKNRLAEAEVVFKKFQEQKGLIQVSSQVEAVIRSMAQMRAEAAAREIALQRLKAGATMQNPEVLRQEIELTALRNQLRQLEEKSAKRNQGDPLLPTAMVPEAGLEYARRLREVKYHETLFELLAKQYELAKIDEAKESPVIQVVDAAIPPDKKSAPQRTFYAIAGVIFGGILGILIVLGCHAAGSPINSGKVTALRGLLRMKPRK
jgi:tyrosine-protein kinase Etk/Wzc